MTDVVDWSLRTWKERHDKGYFPNSQEHANWYVYDAVPDWLIEHGELNNKCNALEIGCGYGQWMIPLSKHVGHVSGFDIHAAPIAKAIEKFNAHGVFNASVGLGHGDTIQYPSGVFDLVYSISVFQHLPRPMVLSYLKESKRVLVDNGVAVHHFRNADNVGPYPKPADDIVVNHTGDFSCGWTTQQIIDAAGEAGFTHCKVIDLGLFLVLVADK